jgi:hypothetical protein
VLLLRRVMLPPPWASPELFLAYLAALAVLRFLLLR